LVHHIGPPPGITRIAFEPAVSACIWSIHSLGAGVVSVPVPCRRYMTGQHLRLV